MKALLPAALVAVLVACAPATTPLEPFVERRPDPVLELPAHRSPVEWWYFSGHLEAADGRRLAFASTIFQVFAPPSLKLGPFDLASLYPDPFYFGHGLLADLGSGQSHFSELSTLPRKGGRPSGVRGSASRESFDVRLGSWRFARAADGAYTLRSTPDGRDLLDLRLTPLKPEVAHGPGWSGSAASGRMYYTSATRLQASGSLGGVAVSGSAWFDHQWGGGDGDGSASATPRWDWLGIQLDDGRDIMVYRVRDPSGGVSDQFASITDARGKESSTRDVVLEGSQPQTGPSGASYPTAWRVRLPDGTDLTGRLPSAAYELTTSRPSISYLEGPATVSGSASGVAFVELTGYPPAPANPLGPTAR